MRAHALAGLLLASLLAGYGTPRVSPAGFETPEAHRRGIELYRAGRYAEAEPLLEEALEEAERTLGPEHPGTADRLNGLGLLYDAQGRYAEAEALLRRSLALRERTLGPDHPDVAHSLEGLFNVCAEQGRDAEAELVERRALEVREAALGPDHPDVAESLYSLGSLYRHQGRHAEAGAVLERSLAIREKALGPDNPDVSESLESLGILDMARGRLDEAEARLRRAPAIKEGTFGPDHLDVAVILTILADVHAERRELAEAVRLYRRPLAVQEEALGPDHPRVAWDLRRLAFLYADQGRLPEATETARQAARIWRVRLAREALDPRAAGDPLARAYFAPYVTLAADLASREPRAFARMLDEVFQAAQLAQQTDIAAVVARVAARFAAGDDELARLVRERQDLVEQWRALDRAALEAAGRPAERGGRGPVEGLRRELERVDRWLDELDRDLSRRFPEYAALASPEPAGLGEVRQLLRPDEALLAYLVLDGPDAVLLAAVRHDRAEMYRLETTRDELDGMVRELRGRLDPGRTGAGPGRFDAALAHALYRKLLPSERTLLAGARHLLIVPDGPLDSLPFGVLVRSEPDDAVSRDAPAYRRVDWLARHYATTTLPSVPSLRALRRFAKPSRAAEPFRGVGDPLLQGHPGAAPRAALASLFTTRGRADLAQVRRLPSLPDTADELRTLAASLRAGEGSLLLRERATERDVKAGGLAAARVVAFATHAGVAGELPGLAEPALVLTPPAQASEEDDGLLTASEVARLELDADFVILSACNTAAPDGTPGAPGLSGLARAFLHAGSRSLLVSHWPVYSDAAVRLTTGMFAELAREPGMGRSEALRRSMLAVLGDEAHPDLAHPAAWAPFVVVGEGGPLVRHP